MESTATVDSVEVDKEAAINAARAERFAPWVAGVVEFQKPWSDEEGDGDYLQGYCLGNGTTLVMFYDGFHHDPPTMCLLSDEDARTVQARHRSKHWHLDWIDSIPDHPEGLVEIINDQDLFQGLTRLPMPVSKPLTHWPGEAEKMKAKAAREEARHEHWKRDVESELAADMAKNPDKYNVP